MDHRGRRWGLARLGFNDVTFDAETRQVWCNDSEVRLSHKAFELLALLIERRPQAVSKQEIRDRLWPDTHVSESNLPALVSEVRDAIADSDREPRLLRTLHGYGYAFDAPPTTPGPVDSPSEPGAWLVGLTSEIPLECGENVLGREGPGVILLKSTTVSRRHVRVVVAQDSATAEDLGSKNGTYVNDQRLTTATRLVDGDQLRIGSLLFTLRMSRPSASTASLTSSALPTQAE
jgi:DNA-binding winged helix-turn-helix (wHTH) protein